MGSSTREEIVGVFDALDADLDRLGDLSFDALTTPERLRALERLERIGRRLRAPGHQLINLYLHAERFLHEGSGMP